MVPLLVHQNDFRIHSNGATDLAHCGSDSIESLSSSPSDSTSDGNRHRATDTSDSQSDSMLRRLRSNLTSLASFFRSDSIIRRLFRLVDKSGVTTFTAFETSRSSSLEEDDVVSDCCGCSFRLRVDIVSVG